jgi:hypothetical protein
MSYLHIANYFECDRVSAVANSALVIGSVCKVTDDGKGQRLLTPLTATGDLVKGKYCIVTKESVDPFEVTDSTIPATLAGNRIVTIASGDNVLELRRGVKVEYSADLLDDSLNPANGGATPLVGDQLAIKGSKWAASGASGVVGSSAGTGEVFRVFGTHVIVELL